MSLIGPVHSDTTGRGYAWLKRRIVSDTVFTLFTKPFGFGGAASSTSARSDTLALRSAPPGAWNAPAGSRARAYKKLRIVVIDVSSVSSASGRISPQPI